MTLLLPAVWMFLLCVLGDAAVAESPYPLRFARHGDSLGTRDAVWMRTHLAASRVRVRDPYEAGEVEFDAYPLPDLLDAIFGPSWRDEEELLFTCRDGYQPTIPVARVLAHHAWLAFDRAGESGFRIDKMESGRLQKIELAPYYLIWQNLDDRQVLSEGDWGWPYQLVGIELIRVAERFPALAPPPDSPPAVVRGLEAFRRHCNRCHPLNGEGGGIGPELNRPISPVEVREKDWLRRWIADPGGIRPDSRMPALNSALPDRERIIDEILDYLAAMARARSESPEAREGGATSG